MSLPVEKARATIEEYLRLEEAALDRHEFHDGEILAMSGGTYRHSAVNTNLIIALGSRLAGKPCRLLDSNMRVRITGRESFVYPDFSILCGKPEFDPDDRKQTTILNPRAIVEVLSESTEKYDRSRKFRLYQLIPALEEYLLVSQDEPSVESYLRQPDGTWNIATWMGLQSSCVFRSLKSEIPLSAIYQDIDFDAVPPA